MNQMTYADKEKMVNQILEQHTTETELAALKNFVEQFPEHVVANFKKMVIWWNIEECKDTREDTMTPDPVGVAEELHDMLREKLDLPVLEKQVETKETHTRVAVLISATVISAMVLMFFYINNT